MRYRGDVYEILRRAFTMSQAMRMQSFRFLSSDYLSLNEKDNKTDIDRPQMHRFSNPRATALINAATPTNTAVMIMNCLTGLFMASQLTSFVFGASCGTNKSKHAEVDGCM